MSWPHWIVEALTPTARELDAVDPGADDDLLEIAREATSPLEDELAMMARRPLPQTRRSLPIWVIPMTMAAVAVATLWVYWPAPVHTDLPLHSEIRLVGAHHDLGPDIDFRGIGDIRVEAAGIDGNVVRVLRGAVHFEVDPNGLQRDLQVLAGDTIVEVRGTVFDVYFIDGHAAVDVTRGRVAVSGPWTGSLVAGQSWTEERPDNVVIVEGPRQPPVEIVRIERIRDTDSPVLEDEEKEEVDLALAYTRLLDQMEDPNVFDRDLLRQIERFLDDHPESALVEDATALRLEVESRIRPVWQVVPDIDAFVTAYPKTPRRLSLLELRATLLRENQDCEGALPTYRVLASDGKGQLKARAEAWRGLCALQLGKHAEARKALATALTLNVKHPLEGEVRIALESMQ